MSDSNTSISRPLAGAIAAGCLLAALGMWLWWPNEPFWYGSLLRVGVVMVVFWFALPTHRREAAWARVSPWALVGIAVVVVLLPRFKQIIIPMLIVLAIAAIFLRPRPRGRPPGPA